MAAAIGPTGLVVLKTRDLRAFLLHTLRSRWRNSKAARERHRYPGRNPERMVDIAKAITTEEIKAAADYFSALKPRSAIRVVEAVNAPKTRVVDWHLAVASTAGTEPLGQRIIEVPENLEQFERRDGRSRWVAYVPLGSVQRGQKLVTSGAAKRSLAASATAQT